MVKNKVKEILERENENIHINSYVHICFILCTSKEKRKKRKKLVEHGG